MSEKKPTRSELVEAWSLTIVHWALATRDDDPAVRDDANKKLRKIVGGWLDHGSSQSKKRRVIARAINNPKAEAKKRAQEIAKDLWVADFDKLIGVPAMAKLIAPLMMDEGFGSVLPDTERGLRAWIGPVAPAYARSRGRPKNVSP